MKSLLPACCLFLSLFVTSIVGAATASAAPADAALAREVNAFVDGWHDDAAHARMRYFDKIAPDGVFIGTDRSELWRRDAFLAWGRKYFEGRSKAWEYHATRRNVYASKDGKTVWFDELLDGDKGAHFMASGVLARTPAGLLVEHYQLSVAVPNEVEPQVVDLARAAESKAEAEGAPKADVAR
ncbi:nuclear transport factor 2 family protein [Massilia sp. 9096]|uniref:nuclear transport factor 2 family protein n=1 Tax=Massilia sp. 9096 TaxID=1500894 RepID=UPI00068E6394|nr:nuclear transport factor 2 family protein [Massilia sp. 9096]